MEAETQKTAGPRYLVAAVGFKPETPQFLITPVLIYKNVFMLKMKTTFREHKQNSEKMFIDFCVTDVNV